MMISIGARFYTARGEAASYRILCEPEYPDRWRSEPYYSQLLAMAAQQDAVRIRVGTACLQLGADGSL
jgi:hypothetical protein